MKTKEEFAQLLSGRSYGHEITKEEEQEAKDSGLVVIYGYSDDNVELAGAIHDEVGCYDGGVLFVHRSGVFPATHECDCEFCGWRNLSHKCANIEALWCDEGAYSWTFKTELPNATFEVVEDNEPFCRGIVLEVAVLPEL